MMEEVAAAWGGKNRGGKDRVRLMLGVDGPQRCTPRLLELAGDFCGRIGGESDVALGAPMGIEHIEIQAP